jgi:hypothetical protein
MVQLEVMQQATQCRALCDCGWMSGWVQGSNERLERAGWDARSVTAGAHSLRMRHVTRDFREYQRGVAEWELANAVRARGEDCWDSS